MGREARGTRRPETRIKLTEGEFFRLLHAIRHAEVLRLEARERCAQLALEMVQQEIAASEAKAKQILEDLAKTYGFDPARTYRWNETTCELIAVPGPPPVPFTKTPGKDV